MRRLRPAFEIFVDRLDVRLRAGACGQPVEPLAVEHIADANADRVEAVEHVELRQRDAVDARNLGDLTDEHAVEPAAAPLAARDGAELAATLADLLAERVRQLGRKRPGPDARRVGLGNAEHVADVTRGPMPEPVAACAATVFDEVTNG